MPDQPEPGNHPERDLGDTKPQPNIPGPDNPSEPDPTPVDSSTSGYDTPGLVPPTEVTSGDNSSIKASRLRGGLGKLLRRETLHLDDQALEDAGVLRGIQARAAQDTVRAGMATSALSPAGQRRAEVLKTSRERWPGKTLSSR